MTASQPASQPEYKRRRLETLAAVCPHSGILLATGDLRGNPPFTPQQLSRGVTTQEALEGQQCKQRSPGVAQTLMFK